MAVLQGSGTISLANIAGVMGGATPHSLSEYYRGGALVPTQKQVSSVLREPASGDNYHVTNYYWYDDIGIEAIYVSWNGAQVFEYNYNPITPLSITSYTFSGYTYYRGTAQGGDIFAVYRTSGSTTWQDINTNVPGSGTISFSQFYSAEKP